MNNSKRKLQEITVVDDEDDNTPQKKTKKGDKRKVTDNTFWCKVSILCHVISRYT